MPLAFRRRRLVLGPEVLAQRDLRRRQQGAQLVGQGGMARGPRAVDGPVQQPLGPAELEHGRLVVVGVVERQSLGEVG